MLFGVTFLSLLAAVASSKATARKAQVVEFEVDSGGAIHQFQQTDLRGNGSNVLNIENTGTHTVIDGGRAQASVRKMQVAIDADGISHELRQAGFYLQEEPDVLAEFDAERNVQACADDPNWWDSKYGGTGTSQCNSGPDGGIVANPQWCTDYGDYSAEARRACPVACGACQSYTYQCGGTEITVAEVYLHSGITGGTNHGYTGDFSDDLSVRSQRAREGCACKAWENGRSKFAVIDGTHKMPTIGNFFGQCFSGEDLHPADTPAFEPTKPGTFWRTGYSIQTTTTTTTTSAACVDIQPPTNWDNPTCESQLANTNNCAFRRKGTNIDGYCAKTCGVCQAEMDDDDDAKNYGGQCRYASPCQDCTALTGLTYTGDKQNGARWCEALTQSECTGAYTYQRCVKGSRYYICGWDTNRNRCAASGSYLCPAGVNGEQRCSV